MSAEVCCLFSVDGRRMSMERRRVGLREWRLLLCVRPLLHQLRLVQVRDPALQLLRVFGEKLEFGAVTFRMFARVVVPDLSWESEI